MSGRNFHVFCLVENHKFLIRDSHDEFHFIFSVIFYCNLVSFSIYSFISFEFQTQLRIIRIKILFVITYEYTNVS